jgi:hypothetical protein
MTLHPRHHRIAIASLLTAATLVGCRQATGPAPSPSAAAASPAAPLEDATARARRTNRPVAVLVIDPDRSQADRDARTAFESATAPGAEVVPVVMDLRTSRNRAAAAPLHAVDAPTLVCLSLQGIVVSRDQGAITADLVRRRRDEAVRRAPALDRDYARLHGEVVAKPDDVAARMALADFLLARHNDREAIPHLKWVADNASADLPTRVRAWVAMARAHLWDIEPEKARHAAQSLMATLGPTSPDAIAGGNLVRGLQDTRAKRYDRARDELAAAVAAAPDSPYGREAAELLTKLPRGN